MADARLTGEVVNAASGLPIAGARINLILVVESQFGTFGRDPRNAVTDASGRFAFAGLDDGRYSLEIQKPGFAPYPDIFGEQPPTPLHIATEESTSDLRIELHKGSVIAGRLVDSNGEPVPELPVSALRRTTRAGSIDFVQAGRAGETNDIGEFRIAGLAAGEYLVAALPRMQDPFVADDGDGTTVVATYYPGTSDRSGAQALTLAVGEMKDGLQFSPVTARAYRVSGVVVDAAGRAVQGAMVMLVPNVRTMLMGPLGRRHAGCDGAFSFAAVSPGSYFIRASRPISPIDGGAGIGAMSFVMDADEGPDPHTQRSSAQPLQVAVADRDVTGLRILVSSE